MNVGHANDCEHRQIQNADAPAEVASIDGNNQLEDRSEHQSRRRNVVPDAASGFPQARAKSKKQGRSQHEPGEDAQEGLGGSVQQEISPGNSANHARDGQRNHDALGNVEMLAKRAPAGGDSNPERNGVGGVRWNRRDSGKEQRRKCNKASASGDGVQRTAQRARYKQEDGNMNRQVLGFTMSNSGRRARIARGMAVRRLALPLHAPPRSQESAELPCQCVDFTGVFECRKPASNIAP